MNAAEARTALALAYAATPAEYRSFFGVTTLSTSRATIFLWRNAFTGGGGRLASVKPGDLTDVTLAILEELHALRTPERKAPQSETAGTMRRRKTA